MTFAAPAVLSLLVVLLPAIVVLHTLRRKEHATASLFLWEKVASRRQGTRARRSVPWRSPLLWLHLAIAAVAVLALAGPKAGSAADRTDHLIVLLDASRTMRTADLAPTRFGAAVDWLRDALERSDAARHVSLVAVGHDARLIAARQPAGTDLASRLDGLEVEDTTPAWPDAMALARSLLRAGETRRVWIVTDGASDAAIDAALGSLHAGATLDVERVAFGGPFVNVGVGRVDVEPRGTQANRWTVSGEIRTVGLQRGDVVRVQVFFRPDGSETGFPWSGSDVEVGRAGVGTFELPIDLPGDGVLEVRTSGLDQQRSDDVARRVLRGDASTARVALVGPQDPALFAALMALGDVEVYGFENVPGPEVALGYDLVIVTGPSDEPVATSVLWFGAPPPAFVVDGAVALDDAVPAAPGHPLMRDVDPGEMDIRAARPLDLPTGAQSLIEANGAVLAWARTTEHGRQVALGFGPDDSAWASQLSFPVFVAGLVEWARSTPTGAVTSCLAGEPCPLPKEAYDGSWTVLDEDGAEVALPVPLDAADDRFAQRVWIPGTFERAFVPDRAGLYELRPVDGASRWLAVDADLATGAPEVDGAADVPERAPVPVSAWRWLAVLALMLLAVDGILFVRSVRSSLSARSRSGRASALWALGSVAVATAAAAVAVALVPTLHLPASATHVVLRSVGSPGVAKPAAAQVRDRLLGWRTIDLFVGASRLADERDASVPNVSTLARGVDLARALRGGAAGPMVVDARELPADDLPMLAATDLLRSAAGDPSDTALWPATVPAPRDPAPAVLRAVDVPTPPRAGGAFELVTRLEPQTRPTVLDVVDESGRVAASETVPAGTAVVRPTVQAGDAGREVYTLRLRSSDGDDEPWIDETDVVVNVSGPLEVLVVTSTEEDGTLLAAALEAQQVRITRVAPDRIPATLERLTAYDVVLLVDVPASEIHPFFQDMLQRFVRDLGGGLVMTGGTRSFGPGGYYSTVLDEVSPLSSRIEEDAPEVAMTFVLDRSGSMNAVEGESTRLDLAKLATFEAIRLLGERSQAALVAFDTVATTLLPLQSTAALEPFRTGLQAIVAGGGTSIYPSLVEAYDVVAASDAATRHVIVLTDGLSEEGDFETILGRIRGLGVNTSFVGVGDAASRGQLTRLVGYGGGSLHFTSDARALPGILAQEALMLSADPIEEGPTPTTWVGDAPPPFLGQGARAAPPAFLGYVQTTAKDDATVILEGTASGDPLLATWRYGLGRVAAFATEADGPWSATWTRQDDFGTFWSQLTRWSASTVPSDPYRLDVAPQARVVDVALDVAPELVGILAPVAELVAESDGGVLASAILDQESPARWTARLPLPEPDGALYLVRLRPVDDAWNEPLEAGFVHGPTSWSRASPIDVVPLRDVADGLARASDDPDPAIFMADDLVFTPPRVAWHGSPREWLIASVVAFVASLLIRFGGLSLRGVRRSR